MPIPDLEMTGEPVKTQREVQSTKRGGFFEAIANPGVDFTTQPSYLNGETC
jgi:hypothetical protein